MLCTRCKKSDTRVVDSRDDEKTIRRRRECLKCGHRFTTYEKVEVPVIKVKKKSGDSEPYDRRKIEAGIRKSLEKRPIAEEEIAELIDDIEQEIIDSGERNVPSVEIGEIVSKKLKRKDEVAYLRFISVYKSFSSAKSFENEAKKIIKSNKK